MATLHAEGGVNKITWWIEGLDNVFSPSNYYRAVIATQPSTNPSPNGSVDPYIIDYVTPSQAFPYGAYSTDIPKQTLDAQAGTYYLYGFAQTTAGSNFQYWIVNWDPVVVTVTDSSSGGSGGSTTTSYSAAIYYSDPGIDTTSLYVTGVANIPVMSGSYDQYNPSNYDEADFSQNQSVIITAEPALGYQFSHWEIWNGYSWANVGVGNGYSDFYDAYTYTYDGMSGDIYIRAVSKEAEWTLSDEGIPQTEDFTVNIQKYVLNRYTLPVNTTGHVEMSWSGNVTTAVYFGTSSEWNEDTGVPTDYSHGSTTSLSVDVNAGQTYYLWMKPYADDGSGTIYFSMRMAQQQQASIISMSPVPQSGTLKAECLWELANTTNTNSVEILTSITEPAYGSTSGTRKYTSSDMSVSVCTISFDEPGNYYVWLNLYNGSTLIDSSYPALITIKAIKPPAPEAWAWSEDELNAFNNQGVVGSLTAGRWNAFLDKLNESIQYCNLYDKGSIKLVLDDEKMQANKIMRATSFTSICSKLNSLCSYRGVNGCGISSVSKNDIIFGAYFIQLQDALNRAIEAL